MNWSRGLLRLWIVLALVWFCVAGIAATFIWSGDAPARESAAQWVQHEAECGTAEAPKSGPWCDFLPARDRLYPIPKATYLAVLGAPPLVLFLLGWLVLWAARGFRAA